MILVLDYLVKRFIFPFSFLLIILLSSCGYDEGILEQYKGSIMGTTYKISFIEKTENITEKDIFSILKLVDKEMSTYDDASLLSKINSSSTGSWIPISINLAVVLKFSKDTCIDTGGAFDVSIGKIVNSWGFGPSQQNLIPSKEKIKELQSYVGCNAFELDFQNKKVKRNEDVYIDLSAVAKGFAVDLVAQYLESKNIENYLIELGGELKVKGKKINEPWRVGIENPLQQGKPIFTLVTNGFNELSLATSGNYRNFIENNGIRVSHTFDPTSGLSISHNLASVSVVSESVMKSDALATALNVMGLEQGLDYANLNNIKALFILVNDNKVLSYPSKEFKTLLN